jgi:hypothetical protein
MRHTCSLPVRVALIAMLGIPAGACTSWKTQPVAPDQTLAKSPNQVRVTRSDGSKVVLRRPAIVEDSLVGEPPGDPARRIAQRLAIPLSDVQSVAVQQVNAGRTVLLLTGVGLTAAAVIAAATWDGPLGGSSSSGGSGSGSGTGMASCPLVYSWDGSNWRLDSGTFGGAIAPALARTDVDNLVYATSQAGFLRLRVANELDETDYVDALSILAVDHDSGVTVAPDFEGRIYTLGRLTPPLTASDFRGADALARVRAPDGWNWESNPSGRNPAVAADIRDGIELTFVRPHGSGARLVLDGNNSPWAAYLMQEFVAAHGRDTRAWYDSLAAHPGLARQLGAILSDEAFLGVSVWLAGRWERQGQIWEAGPEVVKRQVFPLDLSRVPGDTVRIRLESAPSFWLIDHVALDFSRPAPVTVQELWPERALDPSGVDITGLLGSKDRQHYVMDKGIVAELTFRVPNVPAGRSRSYLVRSSGWYRIHGPETQPADTALLSQVLTEPHGASRLAVARFNHALLALGSWQ